MKKFLFALLVFVSCTSEKKVLDSWIGADRHALLVSSGLPARTETIGNGEEVLVYSQQMSSPYSGRQFYKNTLFFVRANGTIYHYLVQRGEIPPQRIDLTLYRRF
jgi:hypothetical protein